MFMIINVKSELYWDFTDLEFIFIALNFFSKTSQNESLVYFEFGKVERKLTNEELKYLRECN